MIAALLVGRKGSQSVERKNLAQVAGRPLAWYPLQACLRAERIDEVWCSTDDQQLGALAESRGATWIHRPAALSTEKSLIVEAIEHAMENMPGVRILVVVAANCATHRPGMIDLAIKKLDDLDCDSVVTGYFDNNIHPWRVKKAEGLYLTPWMRVPKKAPTNRQQLPRNFVLDHSVWALNVARCFPPSGQPPWSFMGQKIAYLENPGCIDVHSQGDLKATELWLEEHGELFAADYKVACG